MEEIAKILLESKAVFLRPLEPFTYSSGLLSPIYCDNRVLISHPKARDTIAEHFASLIKTKYKDTELLAGTATGAIAHCAFLAQKLELPMVYILSKSKSHGRARLIEGFYEKGQKTLIIEDLLSSAGSSIVALKAARDAGLDTDTIFSIFTYSLASAQKNLDNAQAKAEVLCDIFTLAKVAQDLGYISSQEAQMLLSWQKDPPKWKGAQ